eukprot:1692124-Rhodomonas_salina.2
MMNNYLIHEIHGVGLVSEIAVPRYTKYRGENTRFRDFAAFCPAQSIYFQCDTTEGRGKGDGVKKGGRIR